MYESPIREPLVTGGKTPADVTADICRPMENKPSKAWWVGFIISVICLGILLWNLWTSSTVGLGLWGINKTVGWAWDITNFVFWVGIGHAGTLISAILLLFRR